MPVTRRCLNARSLNPYARARHLVAAAVIGLALATTGCQVHIAGQTLPSPTYQFDDVQYFPPGEEFLLANEAAALAENEAQYRARGRGAAQAPPAAPAPAPPLAPMPAPGAAPPAPMPM